MATHRIKLAPQEPTLDAADLDKLIDLWIDHLREELPPDTVKGYENRIRYFRDWWSEAGPAKQWQLRRRDLAEYGRHLAEIRTHRAPDGLAYNGQNDAIRRLKQCFRWAYRSGYTEIDHGAWLPAPKGDTRKRHAASLDQLQRLMDAAGDGARPTRDRAILAFLIGTGARRAEAASLKIEDLQFSADGSGIAQVRGKKTIANRTGERPIAFDRIVGAYLIAHIDESGGATTGPLFCGKDAGEALTPQGIYKVAKAAIRTAGLEDTIQGPHDLRRAFATHLARHLATNTGEDLAGDMIRRQLGHSAWAMTERYNLTEIEDIREAIESPLTLARKRART